MRRIISVLAAALFLFGSAFAENEENAVAKWLVKNIPEPAVSYVGGEWAVIGMARSESGAYGDFFDKYYQNAEQYISACGGVLHEKKYTEYSRVIIALTAIGKDPRNVAGCNLLKPIADFDKTVWQGLNGAVWALIALDSGNYEIPSDTTTRQMYINEILTAQNDDGGFSVSSGGSDADMTAMALVALAPYSDNAVKNARERAIEYLSSSQLPSGGFGEEGRETAESAAQVLTALSVLKISSDDPRFVKNGNTVYSYMMSFFNGEAFKHIHSADSPDLMATEQCFYALAAQKRFKEGKTSLFDMSDVKKEYETEKTFGLSGKDEEVKIKKRGEEKEFSDISGHGASNEIKELSARGIINGMGDGSFNPDGSMTRAEFAAITVNALGFQVFSANVFSDVPVDSWYCPYVSAAFDKKIVSGVSEHEFAPEALITREQAAVMMKRAAALCGLFGEYDEKASRDVLSAFSDYKSVSPWAIEAAAFCFDKGIIPDDDILIRPMEPAKRAEIAVMIYNLLSKSNLLKD